MLKSFLKSFKKFSRILDEYSSMDESNSINNSLRLMRNRLTRSRAKKKVNAVNKSVCIIFYFQLKPLFENIFAPVSLNQSHYLFFISSFIRIIQTLQ